MTDPELLGDVSELYDLGRDPLEFGNLINVLGYAEVVAQV